MLVQTKSVAFFGIEAVKITIEVNIAARGFPSFDIVGLAGKTVDESKHRIKTALQNSGVSFPAKKITVNMAPADLPKEGTFYDLPIAACLYSAISGRALPQDCLMFGELSLDGTVCATRGILLFGLFAKQHGIKSLFLSHDACNEAALITELNLHPVKNIRQLINSFENLKSLPRFEPEKHGGVFNRSSNFTNISEIVGQEFAKRALQIAVAGNHNIIMVGTPGSGKTLLAKSASSILPDLSFDELLEVNQVYSLLDKSLRTSSLLEIRPFRAPHHTISYAGMFGGGYAPLPGEVSLSHRGVLFLDEFTEFSRNVIEGLRQPLEEGSVFISRSRRRVRFPSRFMLIAACNPCPCGYYNSAKKVCKCTPGQLGVYRRKLSGPILDRIDLQTTLAPIEFEKLKQSSLVSASVGEEEVSRMKSKIEQARAVQKARFKGSTILTNSEMNNSQIVKYCRLESKSTLLLEKSYEKFNLSARSYFRVLKVSRTISDLEGCDNIKLEHVAEALQYRF